MCGEKSKITREGIIKKARDLAKELGADSLPKRLFIAKTGISQWQIDNLFDGWNEVIREADLIPATNIRLDDDELFQAMFDAFLEFKGVCTQLKFSKICRCSPDVYRRRFGNWSRTLSAFYGWVKQKGKSFLYISELEKRVNSISNTKMEEVGMIIQNKGAQSYASVSGSTRYGDFLNFRGLQHAPLNEDGVIFLFGMICSELGYVVEAVKPGFPDCEAKRKIDGHKDQWGKVRIEFEFQSKNFLEHGHVTTGCDLIICWEHNWTDCPIEVLELKGAIEKMKR